MRLQLNALPPMVLGSLLVVVALWLLLMGYAHADDDRVTFRTVTVDGLRVVLHETHVSEDGREVRCRDYVESVSRTPDEGKTEVTIGNVCFRDRDSAERFTL